jgi:hypothetical protein
MNRRTFAQFLGVPMLFAPLAKGGDTDENANSSAHGKIAITAHPGDGLFTMGAALANQVERAAARCCSACHSERRARQRTYPSASTARCRERLRRRRRS